MITNEKKQAIFDELERVLKIPRQVDDEITSREYANYNQCTMRRAYEQLMVAVTIGKMTKRKVLVDGHRQWAFKMVTDEKSS